MVTGSNTCSHEWYNKILGGNRNEWQSLGQVALFLFRYIDGPI